MNLKYFFLTLAMLISGCVGANAESFFQYPIVPDSITSLKGRCNYLSNHFWDFCDFKSAFSSKQKMADEWRGYLEILQMADADTVAVAVEKLSRRMEKQPKDLLFLASIAEAELYSDSAAVWSDAVYIPIARAVVDNKKIDKASKARYKHQLELLTNSLPGNVIPSIPYTRADGTKGDVLDETAQVVVLFINDPDCSDCSLARIRLHADVAASQLIDSGMVKVVAISAVEPDESWPAQAAAFPSTWSVGANPEIDMTLDLRAGTPDFYVLNRQHKIRFKHLTVDQVIDIMRQIKK